MTVTKAIFQCSRALIFMALAVLVVRLVAVPAVAEDLFDGQARLVMVDDTGCVYCAKWDREVRPGYEASAEGRFAPLRKIRIGSRDLAGIERLAYTPTFVLIVHGQEAGRIVGYGGADFFWGEVDRLYAKAGFRPDTAPSRPIEDRAETTAGRVRVAIAR